LLDWLLYFLLMSDRHTVNTFTMRPSATQVVSYAVILGDITIFYCCITPNFQSMVANITLSVLFGVASIVVIVSALLTSIDDPSDSVVWEHRKAREKKYCMG